VTPLVDDVILRCATCARPLGGDPDEEPTGDDGKPICGECAREREFFVLDKLDGPAGRARRLGPMIER
jgi:hypothetical protein